MINTDFSWNFDSTGITQETSISKSKGMVTGYVFEHPGEYIVECIALDPYGNTQTETIEISVQHFSGTTYYVSQNGNDTNNGLSEDAPWQTANHAFEQLSANTRILFERGGFFPNITENLNNRNGGNMIIGAYGEGEAPILQATNDRVIFINNSEGISLVDLHLEVDATQAIRCVAVENSNNILALRLEIEGSTDMAIYQNNSSFFGVFNSVIHDIGAIGVYSGNSNQFSFVNNRMDNLIDTAHSGHGMRIQGGEKQYIALNQISRLNDTKTALTIRGDGQRHVMIYKNKLDRVLQVNPQNAATISAISYVTIEGNYIGHSGNYVGQGFQNSFNAINIEATNVAVRNNVIDGHTNAISVLNDGNGVLSGDVSIYHNTFNWRPSADLSATVGRLVYVQDSDNVTIRNNLMSVPDDDSGVILQDGGGNSNIEENSNMITSSPHYSETIPEADSHINDILNYQLTETSFAIDSGDNNVPVFYDAIEVSRPSSTQKDLGAFEYVDQTLSNQKEESIDLVKVYPNPFKNFLSIETPLKEEVEIIIVTLAGKVFFKSQLHSFNNIFDTSHFKNGMYLLQIKTSKKSRVYKLIK